MRLSRGARLGDDDLALKAARQVWAGPPALAQSVDLVYMDGPFEVPVPAAASSRPRPPRRDAAVAAGLGRGGNDLRRPNSARRAPDDRPPRLPLRPRGLGHPAGRVVSDLRRRRLRRARRAGSAAPRPIVAGPSPRSRAPSSYRRSRSTRSGQPAGRRAEGDPARGEQRIYDKNGEELGIIAGVTNRTVVPGGAIPKVLKDATVAVEDKRFYDHDGVDYYRLVGAVVHDLEAAPHPGRQHDHDAARQEPLQPARRPDRRARSSRRPISPSSTRSGTRRTRSWRGT